MPTQRRRIGFLPSSEVQNIIDKVCNRNRLSQSKVTGILVEEALFARGIFNSHIAKDFEVKPNWRAQDMSLIKKDITEAPLKLKNDLEELEMMEQFQEFQQFKTMMGKQ